MVEKIIEAKETRIGNLFSEDFIFNIPIYQRPFSWGVDNFEQLFDDIYDSMNEVSDQHFLGSTILQETKPNQYDLVDGQQRMTALTILLAVIRDITDKNELKESIQSYIFQREDRYKQLPEAMRVTPWDELKETFRQYVYTTGGTKKFIEDFMNKRIHYKDTEDPRYHLYEAIDMFSRKVSEVDDLETFVSHVLRNVYMVYIKTKNLTSAFRMFSVLNTRGLQLDPSDILKSENLGSVPDERKREQYAAIWRNIEEELGREELSNIIAHIRTIKKKEKARLGIYEEYQQMYRSNTLEKGVKFIDYVKEIADIYDEKILDALVSSSSSEQNNKYKVIVDLMNRFIPFSDWVPPLLAFHHKFKSDEFLPNFVFKLERKVVIEWAAGFSLTERITSLSRVIKVIEQFDDPAHVIDNMLTYKIKEDKKSRTVDFTNTNEVESYLSNKLDDTRFYNLHGGKFARYILLRIDMELWDLENFQGYPGIITVEHVLPQNPSQNSDWTNLFTEQERLELTNKFGNLVLLSGKKNSKAQNYDFQKKKEVYFKEKSSPFMITRELENISTWDIKTLTDRHNRLVNKVIEIFS